MQQFLQHSGRSACHGHMNGQSIIQIGNFHGHLGRRVAQQDMGRLLSIVMSAIVQGRVSRKARSGTGIAAQGTAGTPRTQIRTARQEQIGRLAGIFLGGKAQWCGSRIGASIDVRTRINQELHGFLGIAIGGIVERRPSGRMRTGVGIGSITQQQADTFGFVLKGGPMQGSVPVTIGSASLLSRSVAQGEFRLLRLRLLIKGTGARQ
mmetsp:Transcript_3558/g.7413  ORF Transcript_3558/g.7413 Transcript_3558/m.7413 type:complete len:207 (-) Transcript_3558:826-1446(-)